jgi:hypothetical protein
VESDLVDALDLDVKQGMRVHRNTRCISDVFSQSDLVGELDFHPLVFVSAVRSFLSTQRTYIATELLVVDEALQVLQLAELLQELVSTQFTSDQIRKFGVGLVQPPSGSDSIGDVGELVLSIDFNEVLEDCGLDEIRMKFGDTIDFVRANDCQVGHAENLGLRFFDDRYSAEHISVLRELALDLLKEEQVDIVYDLKVSWQKVLHKWH